MAVQSFKRSGITNFAKYRNLVAGNELEVPIDYIVVAGGGGASAGANFERGGGGGGAGGYRTGTFSAGPTNFTVTVGAGGSRNAPGGIVQTNGSDSVFGSITAAGGGRGGFRQGPTLADYVGANGGSGGGATAYDTAVTPSISGTASGGSGNVPSVSPSQGNNGGTATNKTGGGGGGGSSTAGGNPTATTGGTGGAGTSSSITGSAVTRAAGGAGGNDSGSANGAAGTVNTGNGGVGGQGGSTDAEGGAGGSGIVLLSYPTGYSITIGAGLTGSTATVGSNKVTTITAGTGNVSWAIG